MKQETINRCSRSDKKREKWEVGGRGDGEREKESRW